MTRAGLEVVLLNVRKVYEANPQVLDPVAEYFDVDLKDRLTNEKYVEGLTYG
jgi:hypothetical protein